MKAACCRKPDVVVKEFLLSDFLFLCYNFFCLFFVSQVKSPSYLASRVLHHNVPVSLLTPTASLTACGGRRLDVSMQHWPGVSRRRRCWEASGRCWACVCRAGHGWLHHQDVRHQRPGQQASVRGDFGTGKSLEEVCFILELLIIYSVHLFSIDSTFLEQKCV